MHDKLNKRETHSLTHGTHARQPLPFQINRQVERERERDRVNTNYYYFTYFLLLTTYYFTYLLTYWQNKRKFFFPTNYNQLQPTNNHFHLLNLHYYLITIYSLFIIHYSFFFLLHLLPLPLSLHYELFYCSFNFLSN